MNIHEIRRLAGPLAAYIALQPFHDAEIIIAEVYDLINELRDARIEKAHSIIKQIMEQPTWPNAEWVAAISKINGAIKQLEGSI